MREVVRLASADPGPPHDAGLKRSPEALQPRIFPERNCWPRPVVLRHTASRVTVRFVRAERLVTLAKGGHEMGSRFTAALRALLPALGLFLLGAEAAANTLTQNLSWTIDRAGTTTKYRVVAYGDSIYAGYNGSISSVAKRAAPTVDGEYLSRSGTPTSRSSGAPSRARSRRTSTTTRSSPSARTCRPTDPRRHVRDVRQRRPAGAQPSRARPAPATTRRWTPR